ncbi:MAG: GNAT family N-acetyltransferase [Halioglobus sp.]
MGSIHIRKGTPADTTVILNFIRELAIYEKALDEVTTDEAMLNQALFGDKARAYPLICELDGQPVGFAIYFYNFSTWLGKYGIFLEDLYLSPEFRGHGAGKALLQYLAKLALAEGCGRFEWNVLDWNEPSIKFYEACGAVPMSEWVGYRLQGNALESFADS